MFKNEFFRLELNEKLIVFYTIPNGANEKQELIAYIVFEHANKKVSQPYKKRGSLPMPGWGDNSYYFECDSAVVDYIILEMFSYRVLEEQGIQMFFGSWKDKEELESLTLAGMPLQILEEPLIMNGETYYFWYLTDISWQDRFSDIQWSSFTYRQIIEALDIQYTPTETK